MTSKTSETISDHFSDYLRPVFSETTQHKNNSFRIRHQVYCEELKFAGYSDWRIPKIEEFETIVDKKNFKNYINKAFKYNVPDGYWAEKAHWRTLWYNAV